VVQEARRIRAKRRVSVQEKFGKAAPSSPQTSNGRGTSQSPARLLGPRRPGTPSSSSQGPATESLKGKAGLGRSEDREAGQNRPDAIRQGCDGRISKDEAPDFMKTFFRSRRRQWRRFLGQARDRGHAQPGIKRWPRTAAVHASHESKERRRKRSRKTKSRSRCRALRSA